MNRWAIVFALSWVVFALSPCTAQEEASWPMAGANPQRTSWTPEEVRGKLYPEWAVSIEPFIPFKNQVIAAYDTIFVSTARGLYALNAMTGALRWLFPTEMPLGNSPTIHDGKAYVGGHDHRLYALNAFTGQVLWAYEGGAGFETNPLVVEEKIILGSRDGYLYAVHMDGTLAWKFKTDGPILFSAAYKDGVIYFASNDGHAYAVRTDGTFKWKSARLPGNGFYSYWPVIYTHDGSDYVLFGGSNDYRSGGELSVGMLNNQLDRTALYDDIPSGDLVGSTGTEPGDWAPGTVTIDASRIAQYLESYPGRRRVLMLSAQNGLEYTFDSDRDGVPEYAPFTWHWTHGGNRYPAVVGQDGVLYAGESYVSDPYIPRGGTVGWKVGTQYISRVHQGNYGAVDEPLAISSGGDLLYYGWFSGGAGMGAYDLTMPYGASDRAWAYWSPSFTPSLKSTCPGAAVMFGQGLSTSSDADWYMPGTSYAIYRSHGSQNAPVPYKGRLYFHTMNTVFAVSPAGGSCDAPLLTTMAADPVPVSVTKDDLRARLATEVQKILQAGHLRPGYFNGGLGTYHFGSLANSYMTDYFHNSADTFITLIDAYPFLSEALQAEVETYLQGEFSNYGNKVHIGWNAGARREAFDTPAEIQAKMNDVGPKTDIFGLTWDWRYNVYGRWRYVQFAGDLVLAAQVFAQVKGRMAITAPEQDLTNGGVYNPYVKNAFIAGYIGYIGLGEMAGYSRTGPDLSPYVRELERLLAERATEFSKDLPAPDLETNVVSIARNFMYLTPELASYLRVNSLAKVQVALDEYNRVGSYWFVAGYDATSGEGVLQTPYDCWALFQAKARILREDYSDLVRWLDVPMFEQGDLYYLQNLVAAIEAAKPFDMEVTPSSGDKGSWITYTLQFLGDGETLTLSNILPAGVGAPTSVDLQGTDVQPFYDENLHRLTWSDSPPAGQPVTIRYVVAITTDESGLLVNSAELVASGGTPTRVTTAVMANPHRVFLPVVVKSH